MVAGNGPRPVRRAGASCISLDMNGLKTPGSGRVARAPSGRMRSRYGFSSDRSDRWPGCHRRRGDRWDLRRAQQRRHDHDQGRGVLRLHRCRTGPLHHHHQPSCRRRQLRSPPRRKRRSAGTASPFTSQLRRILDPHGRPDGDRDHGRPGTSGHHRNRFGSRRGESRRRTTTGGMRSRGSARALTASSSRASRRPISRSWWPPAPYH